ncbi:MULTISPECIES: NupC/NupG family nucleoside CNT transporter [unclassified Erythrobacter]|uniref:NupC/NupG family nucleoside CNT transporter n=1 Tax=unclassified Erythrobacter TaxID=2633097 RepID=UPI0007B89794|nr:MULTISPECIES: nucleoside transporter C-terminal domain-containing protein [unclassified Erythrobacter]KZY95278.1 nucleoside:proton symporter [Erythrobacter sp. HI0074]KZZ05049.1 nucleoside:proton symporter [Erythrobacter sp. HI0077]HCI61914.1 nucleoside:proton symporter [Erythrobacter sp.]
MEFFDQFRGLLGIALMVLLAWAISEDRSARPTWRWIAGALALQAGLALLIVRVPFVWDAVTLANEAVAAIERATLDGSSYMFGYLGGAPLPFDLAQGAEAPVIIAFQILPLVIVFSALAALLWHWGVLRWLVDGLSFLLRRTLRVSGVVGLSGGANMFLGVVESPLVVRAYFARMSRADLFQVMVLAMATISGAILILYATTLSRTVPDAVGHMISASLISLPAALLIAKLMVPGEASAEGEGPDAGSQGLKFESSIDAIIKGTMDGMQLFLAVIAVIIVVFALVSLADQLLALLPMVDGEPLSLKRTFGWLFSPLMWLIGVPWAEAQAAGSLMGTKAILNEYVAYLELAALPPSTFAPRSLLIVTYALCGVANLASIGLLVSTIGTLCPERRAEVAGLGVRSWIAGNMATAMTGAWIGLITWV